jgi:hypothetical protein
VPCRSNRVHVRVHASATPQLAIAIVCAPPCGARVPSRRSAAPVRPTQPRAVGDDPDQELCKRGTVIQMHRGPDGARIERDQVVALRRETDSAALNLRILKSRALELQCFETAARLRDADMLLDEALDILAGVLAELTDPPR